MERKGKEGGDNSLARKSRIALRKEADKTSGEDAKAKILIWDLALDGLTESLLKRAKVDSIPCHPSSLLTFFLITHYSTCLSSV